MNEMSGRANAVIGWRLGGLSDNDALCVAAVTDCGHALFSNAVEYAHASDIHRAGVNPDAKSASGHLGHAMTSTRE